VREWLELAPIEPSCSFSTTPAATEKRGSMFQTARLVFLPPYTPELQPAETFWALVDEPIVNKHVATIEELDDIIGQRCAALADECDAIKSRAGFHWWPSDTSVLYLRAYTNPR
jgi:transposase